MRSWGGHGPVRGLEAPPCAPAKYNPVDSHRDGPVAFAGPAINVSYPRWFEPAAAKWMQPTSDSLTGEFTDSFGHPLTVLAVKNGAVKPRRGNVALLMNDKASGLGIIRFDKKNRRITIECWPYFADVTAPGTQMPGWPVTIAAPDNYRRKVAAYLPTLRISGITNPVVQTIDERNGEIVYTLRIAGQIWRPHVFAPGEYTVWVSDPDTRRERVLKAVVAGPGRLKRLMCAYEASDASVASRSVLRIGKPKL